MEPKIGDIMKVNPSLTGLKVKLLILSIILLWDWLFPSKIILAEYSLVSPNILR